MVWVYIGVVLVMRIFQSLFNKYNAKLVPKTATAYLKYTLFYLGVAGVCAAILFLLDLPAGGTFALFPETAFYAVFSGVGLAVACCCSLYALTAGTVVLDSLFATAGLLVPSVAGIFLFNEVLSVWQWFFVAGFMVGAYFLVGGSRTVYGRFSGKTLLALVLSLLANGLTMLMQTAFSRNVVGGSVSLFSVLSFFSGVVLLGLALPAVSSLGRAKAGTDAIPKKALLFAFFLGVIVFVINQLATVSAGMISPVILFAFINGGATIISALVGLVVFKERLTVLGIAGLCLGLISLLMIKFLAL
ncbi:MAG: hypothetical protein J6L76_00255 [Clostridia bacterium]|nr:hypothetical protein [Clostridia bacterium]